MEFNFDKRDGFTVINFLTDGNVTTEQLTLIDFNLDFAQGFVISGRGPVWLFATIAHLLHPSQWVATHDPRLGGGVVVQSHVPSVKVGDIISL